MIGVIGIALCLAKGQQSSRAGGLPVLTLTGAPPSSLDSEGISVDAEGARGGREVSISQICPFYSWALKRLRSSETLCSRHREYSAAGPGSWSVGLRHHHGRLGVWWAEDICKRRKQLRAESRKKPQVCPLSMCQPGLDLLRSGSLLSLFRSRSLWLGICFQNPP